MANTALAGLALLLHSLCLSKQLDYTLNKPLRSIRLFWPLPPPEAGHQGPAIRVLKPSNQNPALAHLTKIKHFILTQSSPLEATIFLCAMLVSSLTRGSPLFPRTNTPSPLICLLPLLLLLFVSHSLPSVPVGQTNLLGAENLVLGWLADVGPFIMWTTISPVLSTERSMEA